MANTKGVRQADGTICRKGPTCKRHGLAATIHRQLQEAQNKVPSKSEPEKVSAFVHPLLKDGNHVRKGLNSEENAHLVEKLHQDTDDLLSSLDVPTRNNLFRYAHDAFRYVNNYLIGGKQYIADVYLRRKKTKLADDFLESQVSAAQRHIPVIDSVFKQYEATHPNQEERVLYRSFRVLPPEGKKKTGPKDVDDFVQQTYKVGDTITNKAYTSTSMDSDFMLVDAANKPEEIIVHEIVSKKGIPLFKRYSSNNKSIQNAEKEILLPRESTFRVVNVTKATFKSSYRDQYNLPFNVYGGSMPNSKKFTVIQMIEE
jgi:hypothetical protein